MLDIKFIRENRDLVKEAARKKKIKLDLDRLMALDEKRRKLIAETDELRKLHRESSAETARTGGLEGIEKDKIIIKLREEKDKISHKEFELNAVESEFDEMMLLIPNIPDLSVPDGESDAENLEIRTWGEPKPLNAIGGKDYLTLMKEHDMVDLERGAKVSGFRGYFLKNDAVVLTMALWHFTLDELSKRGFDLFAAPSLVREENMVGTGWFPQSKNDVYKTQDDLYLSGTAEVAMMGYHAGEVLEEKDLPRKYAAFSPCFRREAGSYGKDEKGLYRVHEFYKVEQIILCKSDHQESVKWHEELTKNSEEIMQALRIPYHVVLNCGGDLGLGQVKKYDIEGWIPSENKYRETHSASYFHDFQARRLGIKYRDAEGKMRFVHSLNNTAIATPRFLESFIENNQNHDGSINIPEPLQKFFGAAKIEKK
ncbi:serine--tRNA ligase [Candidatus Giovannonibacteria bacterium]|nr:serine--tRNA ligase [Candidatus Giovannonibacteria bacterium]